MHDINIIIEKFNKIIKAKKNIKQALKNIGIEVTSNDDFSTLSSKINNIKGEIKSEYISECIVTKWKKINIVIEADGINSDTDIITAVSAIKI